MLAITNSAALKAKYEASGALPGQSWSLRPGSNDLSAERFAAFLNDELIYDSWD